MRNRKGNLERMFLFLKNVSAYFITVILCCTLFGLQIPWVSMILLGIVFIVCIELHQLVKSIKLKRIKERPHKEDSL
ncbi:hypothetical protein PATA110615_27340 [Paenibacillus taichungensis]